jgi:hypothetical protein
MILTVSTNFILIEFSNLDKIITRHFNAPNPDEVYVSTDLCPDLIYFSKRRKLDLIRTDR